MSQFTDELRKEATSIWQAELGHPFVCGIADGTLPKEKFRFYLCQDFLFLLDYCRVLAYGVIKSIDEATMAKFCQLLSGTLNLEMDLHRDYCQRFGILASELEATPIAPTTLAYTRHLLYVGQSGTLADLVAAILPCQWGYWEIGTTLAKSGKSPQPLYQDWIEMYSSEDFGALGRWLRELLNDLTAESGETEKRRLMNHFLMSSRYEYLFWDMAYHQEQWPM